MQIKPRRLCLAMSAKSRGNSGMQEKTIHSERKFTGRLIKTDLLEVELQDGLRARREIVRHPGAVAALCRRRDNRFVFVRQFRKAVESELLEIVAGTREPGEGAGACIRREIREETGYKVVALARLGRIYTAPGFCDEGIDVFFARLGAAAVCPEPDADERIMPVLLSAKEFEAMLAAGKIRDAKTLAAWTMFRAARRAQSWIAV
ncbi:MAG: NUDIX hydrolase [Kiritimatiellae bacterium]|nr:NUDIX hydrolase [Kiritimatiellia bacterium]